MGAGLVGQQVGADAAREHFGQDFGRVTEQADRDGFLVGAALLDDRHGFLDRRGRDIQIAGAQAHLDAAQLAFDRQAGRAGHDGGERLRAAHAAQARRQQPFAVEAAAMMLAPHLDERLIGALHDALGADIDPATRSHLAVHGQTPLIEFVEMLPIGPVRHQIGVGDQYARCIAMGAEHADGLARLHQQSLVVVEPLQRFDDPVIAFPVARGAADPAIDHQFLGPLGDIGMEIVHQHAQRRFGQPALGAEIGAGGRLDDAAIVDAGHECSAFLAGEGEAGLQDGGEGGGQRRGMGRVERRRPTGLGALGGFVEIAAHRQFHLDRMHALFGPAIMARGPAAAETTVDDMAHAACRAEPGDLGGQFR